MANMELKEDVLEQVVGGQVTAGQNTDANSGEMAEGRKRKFKAAPIADNSTEAAGSEELGRRRKF